METEGAAVLASAVGQDFARALHEGLARLAGTRTAGAPRPETDAGRRTPVLPWAGEDGRDAHGGDVEGDGLAGERDAHVECRWDERRRMARDLHDHIGGTLATARRLITESAAAPQAPARLAAAHDLLREAESHVRELLGELRAVTELPPLREAIERFATRTAPPGVEVTVRATGNEQLIATAHRHALFLAVREALRNCFEHAHASRVTVTLRTTRWWAHAGVEDDGRGFDAAGGEAGTGGEAGGTGGAGLASMAQRMEDIGGRLTIESSPVDGTRVDLHLPLRPRS
ncbi:sensor histidine kinase [Streptomyces sp. NPDC053048]|uniref:sensor histidine kinase n=1 Tax=Streptomyces sp. NPDC053048 TaxID=3365694 RepID=UPI0037D34D18